MRRINDAVYLVLLGDDAYARAMQFILCSLEL